MYQEITVSSIKKVRYQEINGRRIHPHHRPGHPSPPSDWAEKVGLPLSIPRAQGHWGQSQRHPRLVETLMRLKQILGVLRRDPIAHRFVHRSRGHSP
jgi:hypothetical protein